MNITFMGKCQTLSLCYYFQQLLDKTKYNISWIMCSDCYLSHLNEHNVYKCDNIILNDDIIEQIKISDVIIYQNVDEENSNFYNADKLEELKKSECKLIMIPSIYFDCDNINLSIEEIKNCNVTNDINDKLLSLFNKYKCEKLKENIKCQKTSLYLEIIKILFDTLDINEYNEEVIQNFNNFGCQMSLTL